MIPVLSNLEDEAYLLPTRRWSYFSEWPIVSATPENIVNILRKLIIRPELRDQLVKVDWKYVEKYHCIDSAQYLFSNVIEYISRRKKSLMSLYHPLLGEYLNLMPLIKHPLIKNRIIN